VDWGFCIFGTVVILALVISAPFVGVPIAAKGAAVAATALVV